jgi:TolB-like protein
MTPAQPRALHRRRRFWLALGAGMAALGIAADVWLWQQRLPPVHAVTVAPILDQSPAKDQSRFCEGLRAEIVDTLARSPGLQVSDSSSEVDGAILDSMLQRTDDRLILIAQLSRRADGHRYWSKTFSRKLQDAAFLTLDVARSIARIPEERTASHRANLEAYESYLSGRARFLHQDLEGAARDFDRANEADPEFAAGWAWSAIVTSYRVDSEPLRPNEAMPEARDAAEHAVALDPDLASGHLALGIVRLQYDWEWADARSEFDRALQLAPGSDLSRHWIERWKAAVHRPSSWVFDTHPSSQIPIFRAAWQAALDGNAGPARQFLEDAADIRVENYVPPALIALLALRIHDSEGLFHWLDMAYDERCPALPYVYLAPGFPSGDPRYVELLTRLKLP